MNVVKNSQENAEWFENWFNSPFYHKLYNNRDHEEADFFISNLINHLKLKNNAQIWDLACGKGRHSIKLNSLGYNVIGTDLSANSIKEANLSANNSLDFFIHDMRTPFRINFFDAVFNLFTSIGYFDNERDNTKVFENVYNALKPNGVFVIDYLNPFKVKSCMVENATVNKEGIDFVITKRIENNRIIKRIEFKVNGVNHYFEEKVFLYDTNAFSKFADGTGFKLIQQFGDYALNDYNEQTSDRLIMIFKK